MADDGGRAERADLHAMRVADDGMFHVVPVGPGGGFADIFGPIAVRIEGDHVRCRVDTGAGQANIAGAIHGGFIMALVDQAMFCAAVGSGRLSVPAVTVEAGVRFVAGAQVGHPLDIVVETVGETGRMLFLRGLLEQHGRTVASFDGTVRKLTRPAA